MNSSVQFGPLWLKAKVTACALLPLAKSQVIHTCKVQTAAMNLGIYWACFFPLSTKSTMQQHVHLGKDGVTCKALQGKDHCCTVCKGRCSPSSHYYARKTIQKVTHGTMLHCHACKCLKWSSSCSAVVVLVASCMPYVPCIKTTKGGSVIKLHADM